MESVKPPEQRRTPRWQIVLWIGLLTGLGVGLTLFAQAMTKSLNQTPTPVRTATLTVTPNNATLVVIENVTRAFENRKLLPTMTPLLSAEDRLGTMNAPDTPTPSATPLPTPSQVPTVRPTNTLIPTQLRQGDKDATNVAAQVGADVSAKGNNTPTPISDCLVVQQATQTYEALINRRAHATETHLGPAGTAPSGFVTITPTASSTPCP